MTGEVNIVRSGLSHVLIYFKKLFKKFQITKSKLQTIDKFQITKLYIENYCLLLFVGDKLEFVI